MAYQAKRCKKVTEDFELVNESGQVVHVLHVELDAGSIVEKINRKYIDLLRAQADTAKISAEFDSATVVQEAYQKLGRAVADIIEAVFGVEDSAKILKFYENNYVDMVKQVIPFISQIIIPKLREISQQNKKEILSSYNRKARRKLLKGLM